MSISICNANDDNTENTKHVNNNTQDIDDGLSLSFVLHNFQKRNTRINKIRDNTTGHINLRKPTPLKT